MTFERWFLASGIALCLFSLWAIGRHDWLRLVRPSRRITASVTGHRESWENSSRSYAAIYAFTDETGQHEVIDAVHKSFPLPETGARVDLTYPEGRPDLARPPRPLMWTLVYLLLLSLPGLLAAKWLGWIGD